MTIESQCRLVDSISSTVIIVILLMITGFLSEKCIWFVSLVSAPFSIALWSVLCTIDEIKEGNFLP